LFGSKLKTEDLKGEIMTYVKILETNYATKMGLLNRQLQKMKKELQKERGKFVNSRVE
jgi:hypothetical protein